MATWIALLRGINVSGQKIIKMEDLRGMFESMGFTAVRTYIQSGNVIFNSKSGTEKTLLKKIEAGLEKGTGHQIDVLLRSPAELEATVASHPFGAIAAAETRKLYVAFLHQQPGAEQQQAVLALGTAQEKYHFANREVYISVDKDIPKSLFTNMLLEKKLKMTATTRNWATVNKLLEMVR